MTRVAALFVVGACSYNPPSNSPPGDGAADARPDGPMSDRHLAITEICVEGSVEFIEIHNPLPTAVDLSTYYLTDSNEYWRFPGADAIDLLSSDFLVRFPAGATIAPDAVIVIASQGDMFQAGFGMPPTYTIGISVAGTPMVEAVQPDQPPLDSRLTDDGELVVLFQWDGSSDLVRDVDIVVHGNPTTEGNQLIAKEPVDGPDADTTATAYQTDALTVSMAGRGPDDDRFSYKRIAREPETASGGNGITGHDETSEDLSVTWNLGSMPQTPGTFELP